MTAALILATAAAIAALVIGRRVKRHLRIRARVLALRAYERAR